MRVRFRSEEGRALETLSDAFSPIAGKHAMEAEFFDAAAKRKVIIMVSRFGHFLNDLLYRWGIGALPIDIVAVMDLDEGPIIEDDTTRVTHAQSPEDHVSLGRDVEAQVLARAIHAHIGGRVFLNGTKTVVFPPGPGSYASERMG